MKLEIKNTGTMKLTFPPSQLEFETVAYAMIECLCDEMYVITYTWTRNREYILQSIDVQTQKRTFYVTQTSDNGKY